MQNGQMCNASIVGKRHVFFFCLVSSVFFVFVACYFCMHVSCFFNYPALFFCVVLGRFSDAFGIAQALRPGLVKGRWTKEEDQTIVACIKAGITKWSEIAERIPGRIGKQCRERWFNQLDPSIKKGGWTKEEDRILMGAQARMGSSNLSPCVFAEIFLQFLNA